MVNLDARINLISGHTQGGRFKAEVRCQDERQDERISTNREKDKNEEKETSREREEREQERTKEEKERTRGATIEA